MGEAGYSLIQERVRGRTVAGDVNHVVGLACYYSWLLPSNVSSPANMLPTLGNFHIVNMMKGLMMKNCMSIARYQEWVMQLLVSSHCTPICIIVFLILARSIYY